MPDLTKIATCCYCGTRAVLRLGGTTAHHELACRSCGAKLHTLKPLKVAQPAPVHRSPPKPAPPPPQTRKKPAKRRRWLRDVWDLVEDVVDEVFD